jgi:hypothetical protein
VPEVDAEDASSSELDPELEALVELLACNL